MKNILNDPEELRRILLQHPSINEAKVNGLLLLYESRVDKKLELRSLGFSNFMAERTLEIQGWPRPLGWSSVIFYPEGYLPRIGVIFWGLVAVGVAYWIIG